MADEVARTDIRRPACPGCGEYLAQMRAVAGSLDDLRDDAVPAEMRDAVIAAFRRKP